MPITLPELKARLHGASAVFSAGPGVCFEAFGGVNADLRQRIEAFCADAGRHVESDTVHFDAGTDGRWIVFKATEDDDLEWRQVGAKGPPGAKHGGIPVQIKKSTGEIEKGPKNLTHRKVDELASVRRMSMDDLKHAMRPRPRGMVGLQTSKGEPVPVDKEMAAFGRIGRVTLPTKGGKLDPNLEEAYHRAAAKQGFKLGAFAVDPKTGHATADVHHAGKAEAREPQAQPAVPTQAGAQQPEPAPIAKPQAEQPAAELPQAPQAQQPGKTGALRADDPLYKAVRQARPGSIAYTKNGTAFQIQGLPVGRITPDGTELVGADGSTMPLSAIHKVVGADGKTTYDRPAGQAKPVPQAESAAPQAPPVAQESPQANPAAQAATQAPVEKHPLYDRATGGVLEVQKPEEEEPAQQQSAAQPTGQPAAPGKQQFSPEMGKKLKVRVKQIMDEAHQKNEYPSFNKALEQAKQEFARRMEQEHPGAMPPGAPVEPTAQAPAMPGANEQAPSVQASPEAGDEGAAQPHPLDFPHQHTLGNFVEAHKADRAAKGLPTMVSEAAKTHEQAVADALKQGQNVPPEVLSEYAHLQPPHAHQQAALQQQQAEAAAAPAPAPPASPAAQPMPGKKPKATSSAISRTPEFHERVKQLRAVMRAKRDLAGQANQQGQQGQEPEVAVPSAGGERSAPTQPAQGEEGQQANEPNEPQSVPVGHEPVAEATAVPQGAAPAAVPEQPQPAPAQPATNEQPSPAAEESAGDSRAPGEVGLRQQAEQAYEKARQAHRAGDMDAFNRHRDEAYGLDQRATAQEKGESPEPQPSAATAKTPAAKPKKEKVPPTKAAIQRQLLDAYKQYHSESEIEADKALSPYAYPTTFLRDPKTGGLPSEIKTFLEGRSHLRKFFNVTDDPAKANGADAMGDLGDRYFEIMEDRGGGDVTKALDFARKSNDPGIKFLAAVHDTMERRSDKGAKEMIAPDKLQMDTAGTINQIPVKVTENEDGDTVLKDGSQLPETPVAALSGPVPFDKGSMHKEELPEVGENPFEDVMDEPEAEELKPQQAEQPAQARKEPEKPAQTYLNGDRAEYTGKTEQIAGQTAYEVEMAEGHLKGQKRHVFSPPENPDAQRDANAARNQRERQEQQAGFRRLREAQENPAPTEENPQEPQAAQAAPQPEPQPETPAPEQPASDVDTSRQLGLYAKDKAGNAVEVGEHAGQANLFNPSKYRTAEPEKAPERETVGSKEANNPENTGQMFPAKAEAKPEPEKPAEREPHQLSRAEFLAKGVQPLPADHPLQKKMDDEVMPEIRRTLKDLESYRKPSQHSHSVNDLLNSRNVPADVKERYRQARAKYDEASNAIEAEVDHRKVVENALKEGKTVPPHVLAEYPDLAQPKPEENPAEPSPVEALKQKMAQPKPAVENLKQKMQAVRGNPSRDTEEHPAEPPAANDYGKLSDDALERELSATKQRKNSRAGTPADQQKFRDLFQEKERRAQRQIRDVEDNLRRRHAEAEPARRRLLDVPDAEDPTTTTKELPPPRPGVLDSDWDMVDPHTGKLTAKGEEVATKNAEAIEAAREGETSKAVAARRKIGSLDAERHAEGKREYEKEMGPVEKLKEKMAEKNAATQQPTPEQSKLLEEARDTLAGGGFAPHMRGILRDSITKATKGDYSDLEEWLPKAKQNRESRNPSQAATAQAAEPHDMTASEWQEAMGKAEAMPAGSGSSTEAKIAAKQRLRGGVRDIPIDPEDPTMRRQAQHRDVVEAMAKQGKVGKGIEDYPDLKDKYAPKEEAKPEEAGQSKPVEQLKEKIADKQAESEFEQAAKREAVKEKLGEPAPEHDTPQSLSAASKVADQVSDWLKDPNHTIPFRELYDHAKKAGMGNLAEGTASTKDLYDAMELGVNRHVLNDPGIDATADLPQAQEAAKKLEGMLERIPTQTWRSKEQQQFQQFSTPPHYAFAAAWLANLKPEDTVLEPSAGTGSLAVHGIKAGATTIANELSPRRAALLKDLGVKDVHQENAEQIGKILHGKVTPSVVMMNPPFSQTAGRMGDKKMMMTAATHIGEAMDLLPENGRLVAIVGRGMSPESPTFRQWFGKMKENYNLRANVGVSGDVYSKYGTKFGTRMLVFDKNGPTKQNPVVGDAENVVDLMQKLEGVRNDRPTPNLTGTGAGAAGGEPAADQSGVQGQAPAGRPVPESERPVSPAIGDVGRGPARPRAGGEVPPGSEAGRPVGEAEPRDAGVVSGRGPRQRSGERPGEAGTAGSGAERAGRSGDGSGPGVAAEGETPVTPQAKAVAADPNAAPANPPRDNLPPDPGQSATKQPETPKALKDAVFEDYRPPHPILPGAKPHPTKLVESAAMSAVTPPKPSYQPNLPEHIISKGLLSDAQLEPIAYAGQAHNEFLPEGRDTEGNPVQYRRGFFVGDGTGVGKGRIAAGILHDNWNSGRKKGVWISKNFKLHQDAMRDWTALGGDAKHLMSHQKVKVGQPISADEGVLYTGYGTLKTNLEDPQKSRVKQIADWLGKDFDGPIIFDESHMMKGALPIKGKRGTTKATATAMAAIELQKMLPNARITYLSATGATEVSNLGYAQRLGLWGPGSEFADAHDFANEIAAGGTSGMELVAQGMKQQGSYLARQLSYDGVKQEKLVHNLSPDQRQSYDKLCEGWQTVFGNMQKALELTAGRESEDGSVKIDKDAKSAAMSAFWGANQRFFSQVLTSMQMPSIIKDIEQQLKDGKSAVVQLVNTNQASQERALAKMEDPEDLEELDLTPRDQLLQLVQNCFPVNQHEAYMDEEGNTRMRPVTDSKGNAVVNPQAVAMRDKLLSELASIRVPDGPLEMMHNHFGHESVAEVTGRTRRVVNVKKNGGEAKEIQSWGEAKALADANAFQAGKKRILVFSNAGGTGASYHADKSAENQQQRVHYLAQPGWVADTAVQGFGRTHRSGEVNQPVYKLVHTDLNGQKRFISTIARRLDQLGALTRGQRQATSQGMFDEMDNLESPHAQDALARLIKDIADDKVEGMNLNDFQNQTGLQVEREDKKGKKLEVPPIPQFLNRLLAMKIDTQNKVFDHFMDRFKDSLEVAKATGQLDTGVETYRADSINKKAENVVYTDPRSGAQTKHVVFDVKQPVKRNTFQNIAGEGKPTQFMRHRETGKIYAYQEGPTVTDTRTGRLENRVRRFGPTSKDLIKSWDQPAAYGGEWEELSGPEAEKAWGEQLAKSPTHRNDEMHLLTGSILPIWKKVGGKPQVRRLQTDGGEKMLGRVIPPEELENTLKRLGVAANAPKITASQAHSRVLDNGDKLKLSDNWTVKPVHVAGEKRIELIGPDYSHWTQLEQAGAHLEKQGYQTRVFIPTGPRGVDVMHRILAMRPIESVSGGAQFSASPIAPSRRMTLAGLKQMLTARRTRGRQPALV